MWKWLRSLLGEREPGAPQNDSGVLFDGIVDSTGASPSVHRGAPVEFATEPPVEPIEIGPLRVDQAAAERQQWRIVDRHIPRRRSIRREQQVRLLRVFAARAARLRASGASNSRFQGN